MATYEIDKITLPNSDICEITESRNLFVNGGPEWIGNLGQCVTPNYCFGTWSMYIPTGMGTKFIMKADNASFIDYDNIQIKWLAASTGSDNYAQLQHYAATAGRWMGGIDLSGLNDGDTYTISFDYKTTAAVSYYVRFEVRQTSSGSNLVCADNTSTDTIRTLPVANSWTRVSFTYTVPSGYTDIVNNRPNIYNAFFIVQLYPTAANSFTNFRNFQMNEGTNTVYHTRTGTDISRGSMGNYYQGAMGAPYSNVLNLVYKNNNMFMPIHSIKTPLGNWVAGTFAEKYQIYYLTDTAIADINSGNASEVYVETYNLPIPDSSRSTNSEYNIFTSKGISDTVTIKNDVQYPHLRLVPTKFTGADGKYNPAAIYSDYGSNSLTITKNQMCFIQYSPTNPASSETKSQYELYTLPECALEMGSSKTYKIWTSKDFAQFSLASGTAKSFTIASGSRHFVVVAGADAARHAAYIIAATSTGAVSKTNITQGSSITSAVSTNTLTLTSTGATADVIFFTFYGTAVTSS